MVLPNARYRAQRLATAASIEFVAANSAASDSVSIPSHQSGDLLIAIAASWGTPGLASGWTNIQAGNLSRIAYRISDGTLTTTGAWFTAQFVGVVIYRGAHATAPIGGSVISTSATIPALSGIDTGAWTIRAAAAHAVSSNPSTAPNTTRINGSVTGAHARLWDSDGPGTDVAAASITASGGPNTYVLEILPA